jgi:hypothetical protein
VAACAPSPGRPPAAGPQITPMTLISAGCAGNSSEVEEAFAPPSYVYAEWIGCGGIGFARSADSGLHFGAAMTVPGSKGGSWDPAITVGAGGTVYAAFMHASGLAATETVEGVVVRKHYVGRGGEGSSADYWIAVDDRTGLTVAAWKVRRGIYQQVNERDTVRASVTRRYRYVYRVQVLPRRGSPAGSPPGP